MTTAAAAKRRGSTADILPECLVYKVVSYISFKDAAKMSILSKTWLQAYHTHPNVTLGFDVYRSIASADKIMERYRDSKIPIDRFELSSNLFSSAQVDQWFDIALQNGVKNLALTHSGCCYGTKYTYPIVKFLAAAKSCLRELVLKSCDLSLSTCLVGNKLDSLRTLSLITLTINDIALQSLLCSCPLIVSLTLDYCTSLDKIDLRNLQKIRSLTIMTRTDRWIKIQAPTLEHLKFSSFTQLEGLDMVDCLNLRSLEISCNLISDPRGLLELLIFRSQFLESLILVCCGTCLGSFNNCRSQSLRVLKLQNCEIIGEIDAPNLVSFEYKGSLPIPQFKFAKESSQLKHTSVII